MNRYDLDPECIYHLIRGWNTLRLSAEAPKRVPGWDAVILTAASEHQARFYECQLAEARAQGMIPPTTRTLVAPDPGGARIGSGGATFNALRLLAQSFGGAVPADTRILMIHAGGDSKRLPWSNVFGKPFVPLPLLADADRPVPTLFDHMMASVAPLALQMPRGGLLTLTGDVLPIFDAEAMRLPDEGALVVTTPVPLDVGARHGVIVPGAGDSVDRLLQKYPPDRLRDAGAQVGGAVLIDTGIYFFFGKALAGLCRFAAADPDPVAQMLREKVEWSLYEEVASAFVPAHRADVAATKWGARLLADVGEGDLRHHRDDDLAFIHFGSTSESLDQLDRDWHGSLPRRVLAECGHKVSGEAFCYAATMAPGARVGDKSLVIDSRLGDGVRIGNRCVVVNVDVWDEEFALWDNLCLWQLPLSQPGIRGARVTLCCGVDDNPKAAFAEATFCNRRLDQWMKAHGVTAADLWAGGRAETLWTARLFPVLPVSAGLALARWMTAARSDGPEMTQHWRTTPRESLASLHSRVDIPGLLQERAARRGGMVLSALRSTVKGRLDRNVQSLCAQLAGPDLQAQAAALAAAVPERAAGDDLIPASRRLQMRADFLRAGGHEAEAERLGDAAFHAVQDEVSVAVERVTPEPVRRIPAGRSVRIDLPVRFDISGGWSDTPPYALEHPAGVLNLAMTLRGERPVGALVEALDEPVWELTLGDSGPTRRIESSPRAAFSGGLSDPFHLLITALRLTGYGSEQGISQGLRLRSWAHVPKGSGLGTSSILGAAIIQALQRLAGRPDANATVSDLVLTLEQMMTTGGGWQDQVGGLWPGLKFIHSVPVTPIRLHVEPVYLFDEVRSEFEQRFVVAFSGVDRLAKNVLQIVVARYLRRDHTLIDIIEDLIGLARHAQKSFAVGKLDEVGVVIKEVWRLHQQLDPHCSNPAVDAIFREVHDLSCGYKLAGAGGGGFMGILAKDAEAAGRIRRKLRDFGRGVDLYDWSLAQ